MPAVDATLSTLAGRPSLKRTISRMSTSIWNTLIENVLTRFSTVVSRSDFGSA